MVAERLQAATSNLTPPFAAVDLDAMDANAASMITRASGLPIRLATKSIRCRAIINRMLARSGYQGVLRYTLSEAIWLARSGIRDVLLAYPTVDHNAVADLALADQLRESIMIMVDSVKHCDALTSTRAGRIKVLRWPPKSPSGQH
jgi:D-serine deaminase-like pyridoxal phosphate-dependent protein